MGIRPGVVVRGTRAREVIGMHMTSVDIDRRARGWQMSSRHSNWFGSDFFVYMPAWPFRRILRPTSNWRGRLESKSMRCWWVPSKSKVIATKGHHNGSKTCD